MAKAWKKKNKYDKIVFCQSLRKETQKEKLKNFSFFIAAHYEMFTHLGARKDYFHFRRKVFVNNNLRRKLIKVKIIEITKLATSK